MRLNPCEVRLKQTLEMNIGGTPISARWLARWGPGGASRGWGQMGAGTRWGVGGPYLLPQPPFWYATLPVWYPIAYLVPIPHLVLHFPISIWYPSQIVGTLH